MTRDVDIERSPAHLVCVRTLAAAQALARLRAFVRARAKACAPALTLLAVGPALALAALLAAAANTQPAHAQSQSPSILGQELPIDRTKPMLLQADELIYDNRRNRVIARGNVEIYYNNYTLLADSVIYDQSANTLEAQGNVRIKQPDGAIVNAERITLTDDFRDGFIGSLRIVSKEDVRIAAALATRKDGETTIFERAVFTPCKPCRKHPERAPIWQIKAAKIIHKRSEGNIYYENATLEFFGVPVAWVPFFFHADPSVKRRSGLLIPKIGQSEDFGTWVEIPYYWEVAPNMDFTFSPRFMSKQGVLWQGEWRHRLANGTYKVELAGIFQNDSDETALLDSGVLLKSPLENTWRGSLKTEGRFSLGSWWQAGWDVTLESDDTFRRFYKLDSVLRTDRVSLAYLEGINRRNYFGAYLYHFGGLLADDTSNAESRAHPVVDYDYIIGDRILGGELSLNANVTSLSRDDGADSTKLIAAVKWRRQLIDDWGQVFTPFAEVRGDVYKVSNHIDPATGLTSEKDTIVRGMATAGFEYSYPFVTHTESASHVIEPVAQVIARPSGIAQDDVPNEDAKSLVFDDSLLFDIDKFSGYDRIETGVRANYGLRYTMQSADGGYIRAVVGKSQQLAGDNPFAQGTGLSKGGSDYVLGLYYQPMGALQFIAQSRFDADTFELKRQDVSASLSYGPLSGTANYAFTRKAPILGLGSDEEEVSLNGQLRLAENWYLLGGLHYDLADSQLITDQLGLKYSDECFVLAVTYKESHIQDRDIEPDRSVTIRFEFKHLGGTTFETDAVQQLIASSDEDKS